MLIGLVIIVLLVMALVALRRIERLQQTIIDGMQQLIPGAAPALQGTQAQPLQPLRDRRWCVRVKGGRGDLYVDAPTEAAVLRKLWERGETRPILSLSEVSL